jgi:hypothetical protein
MAASQSRTATQDRDIAVNRFGLDANRKKSAAAVLPEHK